MINREETFITSLGSSILPGVGVGFWATAPIAKRATATIVEIQKRLLLHICKVIGAGSWGRKRKERGPLE
jgi:hypothetical protein